MDAGGNETLSKIALHYMSTDMVFCTPSCVGALQHASNGTKER
jgi:hypothetical protein